MSDILQEIINEIIRIDSRFRSTYLVSKQETVPSIPSVATSCRLNIVNDPKNVEIDMQIKHPNCQNRSWQMESIEHGVELYNGVCDYLKMPKEERKDMLIGNLSNSQSLYFLLTAVNEFNVKSVPQSMVAV